MVLSKVNTLLYYKTGDTRFYNKKMLNVIKKKFGTL